MKNNKFNIKKEIISYIKPIAISLFIVYLLNTFVFKPVKVQGDSMYPTLFDGEYGFSSIYNLRKKGIERFDIVIIYIPETNDYLVKRVIGLPTDNVSYINNKLYINGDIVEETFLNKNAVTNDFEVTLNNDEYYCLGDNRSKSKDSRFYGGFSSKQIKSKDFYLIYPLNKVGKKVN